MSLTKFRTLYEILFRFDEAGKLKGAHAMYLEGVSEDGVVLSAQTGAAVPLSLVEGADALTVKKVLGDATLALLTAKEEAEADAASFRADNTAKDANIQSLLEVQATDRAQLVKLQPATADVEG